MTSVSVYWSESKYLVDWSLSTFACVRCVFDSHLLCEPVLFFASHLKMPREAISCSWLTRQLCPWNITFVQKLNHKNHKWRRGSVKNSDGPHQFTLSSLSSQYTWYKMSLIHPTSKFLFTTVLVHEQAVIHGGIQPAKFTSNVTNPDDLCWQMTFFCLFHLFGTTPTSLTKIS